MRVWLRNLDLLSGLEISESGSGSSIGSLSILWSFADIFCCFAFGKFVVLFAVARRGCCLQGVGWWLSFAATWMALLRECCVFRLLVVLMFIMYLSMRSWILKLSDFPALWVYWFFFFFLLAFFFWLFSAVLMEACLHCTYIHPHCHSCPSPTWLMR